MYFGHEQRRLVPNEARKGRIKPTISSEVFFAPQQPSNVTMWLTFGNKENKPAGDRCGYVLLFLQRTLLVGMINRLATVAPASGFLGC